MIRNIKTSTKIRRIIWRIQDPICRDPITFDIPPIPSASPIIDKMLADQLENFNGKGFAYVKLGIGSMVVGVRVT